jgi:hypothetical protein
MMNGRKLFLGIFLGLCLLMGQAGGASAARGYAGSVPVSGIVQSITLETDPTTGVTIVILDIMDGDLDAQTVRVSLKTAIALGIVVLNGDGKPEINHAALGTPVEINPTEIIIAKEEDQHPVGSALATFFADIDGLDYETIMDAHEQGVGFGVIAQVLWLTRKLEGDAEIFNTLVIARETGDYSGFTLEDGSTPESWGQLRKAVLERGRNGLGMVISIHEDSGNGNGINQDRGNHGNGNQGNPHKDKEKDKKK